MSEQHTPDSTTETEMGSMSKGSERAEAAALMSRAEAVARAARTLLAHTDEGVREERVSAIAVEQGWAIARDVRLSLNAFERRLGLVGPVRGGTGGRSDAAGNPGRPSTSPPAGGETRSAGADCAVDRQEIVIIDEPPLIIGDDQVTTFTIPIRSITRRHISFTPAATKKIFGITDPGAKKADQGDVSSVDREGVEVDDLPSVHGLSEGGHGLGEVDVVVPDVSDVAPDELVGRNAERDEPVLGHETAPSADGGETHSVGADGTAGASNGETPAGSTTGYAPALETGAER